MTADLMRMVAAAVAASPLAEDCVVTFPGSDVRTRATWLRREREVEGAIRVDSSIRIPADDLPTADGRPVLPLKGAPVRIDGRTLFAVAVLERGPVVEITLSVARRGSDALA